MSARQNRLSLKNDAIVIEVGKIGFVVHPNLHTRIVATVASCCLSEQCYQFKKRPSINNLIGGQFCFHFEKGSMVFKCSLGF